MAGSCLSNQLENCILSCLGKAELSNSFCLDLDLFASCWVATHASWAVYFYHFAEAWEYKDASLLNFLVRSICEGVEESTDILFTYTCFFCQHGK
jgi:hypothetical protein